MLGRCAISAATVAIALWAPAASADEDEGIIKAIDESTSKLMIEDKVYQWSSMNSLGPRLDQLNEGDKVIIRYAPTHQGTNVVRRIILVSTASAPAAAAAAAATG